MISIKNFKLIGIIIDKTKITKNYRIPESIVKSHSNAGMVGYESRASSWFCMILLSTFIQYKKAYCIMQIGLISMLGVDLK